MEITLGSRHHYYKTFTQSDFDRFAVLSQDDNPIHVDPGFSKRTKFGGTVAHGMLLYSLINKGISEEFPEYLEMTQEIKFPSPTYAGEKVKVNQEITRIDPQLGLVEVTSQIIRPSGERGFESKSRLTSNPRLDTDKIIEHDSLKNEKTHSSSYKGMLLGQDAMHQRVFNQSDVEEYIALSGDINPLYTAGDFGHNFGFDKTIIPGPLLGGMFSFLLGTKLPGRGTNWLKVKLAFLNPAYTDQQLKAKVKITRFREGKNLVDLALLAEDPLGGLLCQGEALVLVKDLNSQKYIDSPDEEG